MDCAQLLCERARLSECVPIMGKNWFKILLKACPHNLMASLAKTGEMKVLRRNSLEKEMRKSKSIGFLQAYFFLLLATYILFYSTLWKLSHSIQPIFRVLQCLRNSRIQLRGLHSEKHYRRLVNDQQLFFARFLPKERKNTRNPEVEGKIFFFPPISSSYLSIVFFAQLIEILNLTY